MPMSASIKGLCGMAMLLAGAAAATANPLFAGADPDASVFDGTYWVFPTHSPPKQFNAWSSTDLNNWVDRGPVLELKDVRWIGDDGKTGHSGWAPTMLAHKGKYYFYFAIGPQRKDAPSRIGVAVGDRPEGPFVDSGKPLVTGGNGFEAIDPMVFTDPKSKITYLYAGGSAGAKLRVWELGEDLVSLKRQVDVATPPQFTEAPFMHVHNGVYYLSFSHGKWSTSSYSVHYATASSPTGPWTYKGCILQSDATHQGPGHHAFVQNPRTGEWFIIYHRWETTQATGRLSGRRQIAVEPVTYQDNGDIRPVSMTDGKALSSPIAK